MYENGKKLNRHARQEIHREKTKRKFTPFWYASYESYVEKEEQERWFHSPFYERKMENGWTPWHRRWWKGHDSQFSWKKHLKEDAHSKERAHYRQELAHYDIEEDDMDMPKKFSDPWCWD